MSTPAQQSDQFPRKFGKYHLLAPLAQGGMGALYLAVTGDRGFERLLCIKTVLPHLADKEYVARFRDEAKIVVQLSHGNLIPVFDAGQVDGELFLAMDFIKGKDLRAVWNRCAKKGVAFPVDVAVYLTKELCRGLSYAHTFGGLNLVHRDVSPPNILVSYAGEVKLTDFGLASSTLKIEKTVPGIIYGKVAYMSPEQARGDSLDGRSDVYAAGIVLWELLTGRQLFPPGKEQPQDLLKRTRDPDVMEPSQRAPRVPKELDAIVLRSLRGNPAERYADAAEFRDALGAWLAATYPTTDTERMENFVGELFAEDAIREEDERRILMQQTRERVLTLPPTDELRRLLEEAGDDVYETLEKASDRRQDSEGPNEGRRAPDQGTDISDRRGYKGRRLVDAIDKTQRGIAVEVPMAGPGGSTIVSHPTAAIGASATAAAAKIEVAPVEPDIVGQVLDSRYAVERLLGEGGMGRVYLAEHVDIGKKFAIKVLHPVYGRMPDLVERFRREARAASKIGHPNIVDVTDSGTTNDGSVYFVMEYLDGVELANVIDREGAIDIRRALDICTQVCRALSAAHASGIIHRDLKPENIFLTAREGTSDFVKVLDFGIAKSSEAEEARVKKLTSPGMAMGTPEYMAPEQAAGRPADQRCDVYAVGAILYEMLTGSPPYEGANFMEILTRKATLEPTPARHLRPEIPEAVEELLIRTMARSPDDRPPSMEALEYELTKCLAGRGAAVASILGISHDDTFDMNTGVGTDSGTQRARTQDPRTPSRALSEHPRAGSHELPVATPPPVDLQLSDAHDEPVPNISGGGLRALGWVLFLALLVSAGVAVLYVAKGEGGAKQVRAANGTASAFNSALRAGESEKPDEGAPLVQENTNQGQEDVAIPPIVKEPGDDAVARNAAARDAAAGSAATENPVSEDIPEQVKRPDRDSRSSNAKASGPPRSEKEARRLISEAKGHTAKMEWDDARAKYQRVSAGKYSQQQGYLGLASVAFQTKNADLAIKYAKKAGKGTAARMALGNAYFKKNDFRAALDIYNEVLASSPGNKEAQSAARAARKRLK